MTENVTLGDLDCPADIYKGIEVMCGYTVAVINFESIPDDTSENGIPLADLQEDKDHTDESSQDSEYDIPKLNKGPITKTVNVWQRLIQDLSGCLLNQIAMKMIRSLMVLYVL